MRGVIGAGLLLLGLPLCAAPTIDGHVDAEEWRAAHVVENFRLIEPRTREPLPYATRAWLLPTPEGLAVAFDCAQPASVARTRERAARDQSGPVDRVSVTVDFEGAGRTALAFTLTLSGSIVDGTVVNENQYSPDWNGDWTRAVSENAAGWQAEMLLPWHLAPMAAAADGERELRIGLSRVIGSTGERVAWPVTHLSEPRFLSQLEPLTVPAFEPSLLALTPYLVTQRDLAQHRQRSEAGVDVFWKPSSRFQLSATLNPDFGQVESDQLVVNFSAVETLFSDRRPFFTENQALFDLPFGIGGSRLLYTRRVGGPTDDGQGAGDVRAAVKLNGSVGSLQYGVFAADEGEASGRRFLAARGTQTLGEHALGWMLTDVDRPFLDRHARSYALDHTLTRGDDWSLRTTAVGSDIDQSGQRTRDLGWQTRLDQNFSDRYRQQIYFLHMGEDLALNDFGYLDRNDLNYLRYEFGLRRTDFGDDSHLSSMDDRFATSTRRTTGGMHLFDALAWYRYATFDDGGTAYGELTLLTAANDDRLLRGNGVARLPARFIAYAERTRPRVGRWALGGSVAARNEGLEGMRRSSLELGLFPTWYGSDDFTITPIVQLRYSPDWLLWRGGNQLASYSVRQLSLSADLNWVISPRSELRVKLETIALSARAVASYRVGADREPSPSPLPAQDFSLSNLGFQVRYRYELAPLSDVYLVYSRGGLYTDDRPGDVGALLGDAFSLRQDQQLLLKISYRLDV